MEWRINAMGLDAMENAVIPLVINQAAGQDLGGGNQNI